MQELPGHIHLVAIAGALRIQTQKVLLDAISLGYLQDACCFAIVTVGMEMTVMSVQFHPVLPATSRDRDRNRKRAERERREGGREGREEGEREERMEGWKRGDQLSSGPRK